MLSYLPHCVLIGLSIAMPVGPVSLMCVQRSLASGARYGLASGLGAATAHGGLAALAGTISGFLTQAGSDLNLPLRLLAAAVLLAMGVRALRRGAASQGPASCGGLASAYGSSMLMALANPMTFAPYLAVAAALSSSGGEAVSPVSATLGVMLGSACWYVVLVGGTRLLFRNLASATLRRLNIGAGALLIGLAGALATGLA